MAAQVRYDLQEHWIREQRLHEAERRMRAAPPTVQIAAVWFQAWSRMLADTADILAGRVR